jgi:hypothetical protein
MPRRAYIRSITPTARNASKSLLTSILHFTFINSPRQTATPEEDVPLVSHVDGPLGSEEEWAVAGGERMAGRKLGRMGV